MVSTDSRHCTEGCMFFALKGERFDGNQYAMTAIENGASVAVVDDAGVAAELGEQALLVDDALATLQALAHEHRLHFTGPVLQVTGTNGKTTTKELIAAVLGRKYNVLWTQGNLNNHIGVPLTLLRLRAEHEVAIIETGANHPGEIAALTRIVAPTLGLVTNVGRAHLAGFGSFEGVKKTKGELYDYLAGVPGKRVFYNNQDSDLSEMVDERMRNGDCKGSFWPYADGGFVDDGRAQVTFWWNEAWWPNERTLSHRKHVVETQLVGRYNVANLLAAVTVGKWLKVDGEEIDAALRDYAPSLGRSELKRTASNELIVDAYNANPTSMRAALENFAGMRHEHKMVILGDMRELGGDSRKEHRRVVELVLSSDVERAWFVGEEFAKALGDVRGRKGREGEEGGMATEQPSGKADGTAATMDCNIRGKAVTVLADVGEAKVRIAAENPKGFLILVKGSNGTRLWELPEVL